MPEDDIDKQSLTEEAKNLNQVPEIDSSSKLRDGTYADTITGTPSNWKLRKLGIKITPKPATDPTPPKV